MELAERVGIRNAAMVVLYYVMGLRGLSVMSLRAQDVTNTAAKMTVGLLL
jgi:site-specific recombinase XerD